jgi:hypothetical protein
MSSVDKRHSVNVLGLRQTNRESKYGETRSLWTRVSFYIYTVSLETEFRDLLIQYVDEGLWKGICEELYLYIAQGI